MESSIGVVRNMALLLRPSMLDDLGLIPALEWQAREVSRRNGVWVKVETDGAAEQLPEEYKTSVYRIVQEALHNAVRHAEAHRVQVTVKREMDACAWAWRTMEKDSTRRERTVWLILVY